jgi:hypothetical protein
MTVGQWWHFARMPFGDTPIGNFRSAEMPIAWNATILTGLNMVRTVEGQTVHPGRGAVSPTAGGFALNLSVRPNGNPVCFLVGDSSWEHMSNPTFRRWTADDIAKLKNLAQRHPRAEIAAKLGRSAAATSLNAHELKLSLRMRDPGDEVQRGRGAAGRI